MNNFLEELKHYFATTPKEKIMEDWAKSAEFNKVGPTIDEFLQYTQLNYHIHSQDPLRVCLINEYSPKFSSGFFMSTKYIYAKSSIPNNKLSI